MVALHLAVRHPQRVRSLLVACTGASADPAVMEQRAADAEALGMAGVLDVTLARWFTPAALAQRPEHARRRLRAASGCSRSSPSASPTAGARSRATTSSRGSARSRSPTTAVAGLADAASPVERTRVISDARAGRAACRARRPAHDARSSARPSSAPRSPSICAGRGARRDAPAAARRSSRPTRSPRRCSRPSAREGRDPIALYRVLAHSPLMLRAYAGLARGLRYEAQTPRALRELMILRTAQLTGSDYEWAHHRAMARRRRACADEKVAALAALARRASAFDEPRARGAALRRGDPRVALSDEAFAALERAVGAAGDDRAGPARRVLRGRRADDPGARARGRARLRGLRAAMPDGAGQAGDASEVPDRRRHRRHVHRLRRRRRARRADRLEGADDARVAPGRRARGGRASTPSSSA